MTFAELILIVAVVLAIYFMLKPFQRRLENYFLKFFRSYDRRKGNTEIDVTDYSKHPKKKDPPKP